MKELEVSLSEIYGEVRLSRVYDCKDGRKRIDLIGNRFKKTCQLARLVLEAHIGKKLGPGETVDHIDGDKTNDAVYNLRVLSLAENAEDSAVKLVDQEFKCPTCKSAFFLAKTKLRQAARNRRQGKAGPFCGRSCAGKYGAGVGHGEIEEIPVTLVTRMYSSSKHGLVAELVDALVLTCGTHKLNTLTETYCVNDVNSGNA